MFELNATLFAQIVDVIVLLIFVVGIPMLIFKYFFKNNLLRKVERMEADIEEIKKILQDNKK